MANAKKFFVTAPIIGARTLEQLNDNIGSAFISLSDEQIKSLDTISDYSWPYPYDLQRPKRKEKL